MIFTRTSHRFAIVADLDVFSRDKKKFKWISYYKEGTLDLQSNSSYTVAWGAQHTLESHIAYKNRSMELSELVQYGHVLLGFCDITGLVFKLTVGDPSGANVLLRYAIADGNGHHTKPFKSEWATVKDGLLWVGSTGKEWNDWDPVSGKEVIRHHNTQWVKTIEESGRITNYDWRAVYTALRTATNTTFPGYLWNEAVFWDPRLGRWLFLPRRASTELPYRPDTDMHMGTNILISTSEDFSDIVVYTIGPFEPDWGFSSIRKIPGTDAQ
jgi:soluble calcium-activated nucleotidase 1